MTLSLTITKYIGIESNTTEKFLTELRNIDLTKKLNLNPFANPNKNDDTFINILTDMKQRILHKKGWNITKRNIQNLCG